MSTKTESGPQMTDLRQRVATLEAALREASIMPMHWSSRGKQKKFREILGDVVEGKVKT